MDGRPAATLTFALELPATAEVTFYEGAELAWSQACDVAAIAVSAQMVGAAQAALDMTVEYLKIRQQFGVAIGTFQALQHRAAKMFIELELTRSAVIGAAAAVDAGSDELARYASLAKARACETLSLIAHEAIQLHGGIGVTDEHDIGLYLKRWRGDDALLGDASWHRQRWAELGGY
jgi:alkylation response protein AidB-like acyl-CoA dehydrogenase